MKKATPKKISKERQAVPWRMSPEAIEALESASSQSGLSKNKILEICVCKYALETVGLAEATQKMLSDFMARQLVKNKKAD